VTLAQLAALALLPAGAGVEAIVDSVFVVPEASAAAQAWSRHRDLIWLAKQAVALALPTILLFSGLGARLRTRLDSLTGERRLLTATLFAGIYAALFIVVNLPVSAAAHMLGGPVGLAAPSWGAWAEGRLQDAWPLLIGALVLGWAPYWLFARSSRFWPIWASAILIPLGAALLMAQPLGLDLRPLSDGRTRAVVSELATRAGAPEPRVALLQTGETDPCRGERGTVKGLGPTKVLVLGSAFVKTQPERQLRALIAHELKHYVRNDDWRAFCALAALVLTGTGLVAAGGGVALHYGSSRFGFERLADPASLPLLALLLVVFSLAGSAAFHSYGNHVEREADRFALELTRDNAGAAALMQQGLSCTRLKNPDTSWIQQTFSQNHPSTRDRIEFARTYRPWMTGEPEIYARKFRTGGPAGATHRHGG
jgi:Zn-dependent protease with chaperone function